MNWSNPLQNTIEATPFKVILARGHGVIVFTLVNLIITVKCLRKQCDDNDLLLIENNDTLI